MSEALNDCLEGLDSKLRQNGDRNERMVHLGSEFLQSVILKKSPRTKFQALKT
jgi:hypothetical protein